ncbi:MAG TPA: GNAT family N-acetyltransferase [Myxococcota bacterium]|jgi:RimJ/RimL family protein N-acetyltransferase|nr:GNAT family N-acetyltransferase [Myxococcota bacterium]
MPVRPADTVRLVFRSWRADDEPLARALWGDARVTALIDARGALDDAEMRRRLAVEIENERAHGFQYWPIFLREGGAHVGCCGLKPRDPARSVLELGFHLRPAHWGAGYATEAARAVVAHAFAHLGVSALFAGHHPRNAASRRTLEKLGFRRTHDELFPPTGLVHPAYWLSRP